MTLDDRECQGCGHRFQTIRQRRVHEAKVARGERVVCPCGEVCFEGIDATFERFEVHELG